MHLHHINLLAVLVAAISTMIVGFLWYSPILFAKPWMREMGYDPDDKAKIQQMQKSAGPAYAGSFVASLISAFVLALVFHWMRVGDLHAGLGTAFHVWLGFVATVQFTDMLFQKKSLKLFAINTGYQLLCYLAMGANPRHLDLAFAVLWPVLVSAEPRRPNSSCRGGACLSGA